MGKLGEVWGQVKSLIADGISIIPVRDKNETTKAGEVYAAKTPYKSWKEFQNRQVTEQELWMLMEERDTTAIAIVCGKISGSIEVIDIDVKYKAGIDAILMADIQKFYPELFDRLRIHKTPSGGYHIVYRVTGGEVPGNLKLAGRPCTEDEIQAQKSRGVKRPNKEANFLETRGEGGYILAPPSIGYAIHKAGPIPTITWEERCSLITLCQTYNEIIKIAPQPKPTKSQDSIYDENPFEHFNRVVDPTELMTELGWTYSHDNNRFIWYTRPGKGKGVSISWNKLKSIFYVFTSSTELQSERGYNPATILAELKFDGDKSKTYYWLTQNGYGKVKKKVEQGLVKKAAISGGNIPANFSEDAKQTFESLKITIQEDHPFGIFWEQDDDGKITISREGVYQVSHGLGFRLYKDEIVRIEGIFVYHKTSRDYFDELKNYIREEDADLYEDICNAYESFIQKSGQFTISRLREFNASSILTDSIGTAYKFYSNCYVTITKDRIETNPYEKVTDGLIWGHKVFDREWIKDNPPQQFKYLEYLHYATGGITNQIMKIIGYLAHDYKDENTGYIITLVEKCPDPKQGGGSGKNIFGNLFRYINSVCTISGEQIQYNEKFLQAWNSERIFFIADAPKKFNFTFLKEISTGYGVVKKLYKNEQTFSPKEMPKILINTNFSYDISDGGLKRRIIPVEFTDFFTRAGGVDAHFNGCMFPAGWSQDDWIGFDHLMAMSLQRFFEAAGKITATELSITGWEKQFKQNFGELTYQFIEENIDEWTRIVEVPITNFNTDYDRFIKENNVQKQYTLSAIIMNRALNEYCTRNNILFDQNKTCKDQLNNPFKAKVFERKP